MSRETQVDEFEADGVRFRLKPLPVLVAERLAPALTALLTPAAATMFAAQTDATELGKALSGLQGAAEQLPKFREAFAAQCLVTLEEKAEGQVIWSELKGNVLEATFSRRHRRYYEWLARCINAEYGAFLAEIGQKLEGALKGSRWSSLIGSLGGSGDSPPTPESKTA